MRKRTPTAQTAAQRSCQSRRQARAGHKLLLLLLLSSLARRAQTALERLLRHHSTCCSRATPCSSGRTRCAMQLASVQN